MKRLLALAIILLATACENPVEHFTEPRDKGKRIVIPSCPADALAEPLPPGMPDTSACVRGRP